MTRIVALSGGVGGAKLALGLTRVLPPDALLIVANDGDDFEHLGLLICPDLDTLTYTVAGIANPATGWGRTGETWTFMNALETLGGETWFKLGDGDLALHVERTRRLGAGESLTGITESFAGRFGVAHRIVPMSDDPVRTLVDTKRGTLSFQHYFVRERCRPAVERITFEGIEKARPSPPFRDALRGSDLEAVVLCPSNPFVSIDPILALPGVAAMLGAGRAPVVAVSPIVGGKAIKGPTDKIMRELGLAVSPLTLARHYAGLVDGIVLDARDQRWAERLRNLGPAVIAVNTVMNTLEDKVELARAVLDFARDLRADRPDRASVLAAER